MPDITGIILALLAVAAGIWANVMVYFFVMERRKKRSAAEEHRKAVCGLEGQLQELMRSHADREQQSQKLRELLELTGQAGSLRSGSVGVFIFEQHTGRRLLESCSDPTMEARILAQQQGTLLETLQLWQEQEAAPQLADGSVLALSVCCNDWARAYVVTDVTQDAEISRLRQEQQIYQRGDLMTCAMNYPAFLQQATLYLETHPQEGASVLLLHTDLNAPVPEGICTGSREAYLKACAQILAAAAPEGLVGHYGLDNFCCLLTSAGQEVLQEIYQAVLKARDLLGIPDDWQEDRCILGLAQYLPESLDETAKYLDICIRNALGSGRVGIQYFSAEEADRQQMLQRYEAMQGVLRDRRIRYRFQPIVNSGNARIWGYEMVPYFPTLPFWSTEEAVEQLRAFGLLRDVDQMMSMEAMGIYTRMVEDGRILYHSHVWIRSLPGACMGYGQGIGFYEKQYDYMKNIVVELTERTWEYAPCAELKRARVTKWGSMSALRLEGKGGRDLAWLHYLQPDVLRIPVSMAKEPEIHQLTQQHRAAGGTVLVDQIRTAAQLDAALRLNAEYLQGDYLGKAEEEPGDLQDRAVDRIAAFRFGKK